MHSLFGTDGIRARIGTTPLTPPDMMQLGKALGAWITHKKPNAHIILGHDTRHSAPLLKNALKAGLLQYPIVLHDAQILPTPALFYYTTQGFSYDFGIMLTASHNPYQDNGIKIFTAHEGKLTPEDEATLTHLFHSDLPPTLYEFLGTDILISDPLSAYLDALRAFFPDNFLQGITLVVDCAHGAYAQSVPQFLESLGAQVIPLAITPNGKNINDACGSLHPEAIHKAIRAYGAHAGFAFDGDGNRLVAVAQDGSVKDGDELIAFLLQNPLYQKTPCVVGTILSNQGLQHFIENRGTPFYRTPVGDKLVVKKMKETGALLGGEPSGHLILRDFTDTADGLFTLLQIASTAIVCDNWLLKSFTKLPQAIINLRVACKKDLSQDPYASIIAAQDMRLQQGRLIVRYSGTEPLLRIMVEATTQEEAVSIGTTLSEQLAHALTQE